MKKLAIFAICALTLASCNDGVKKAEEAARLQRDSLNQIIAQKDNEINDMMTTLSDIEEGFREITEAQNRVTLAKSGEGTNTSQRIKENFQFIQSMMQQNKDLINKLKQQVRESSIKGDKLKKIIANLTEQMETKDKQITELVEQLELKNIHIGELKYAINSLKEDAQSLQDENEAQSKTINAQDKQLNTAWFAFGTKDELKKQRILESGKVLQSNFNKEYFTKIDIRVDKEIKLYSKSAKLLTTHPASAYTLQQDANKQYVLRITDPQAFWSTSKYLVVQVK